MAFQEHYFIHEDIVELARQRINGKTPDFFGKVRDGTAVVALNP